MKSLRTGVLALFVLSLQGTALANFNDLYTNNCAGCHGANGEGRIFRGPALVNKDLTAAYVKNRMEVGPGSMPRFTGVLNSSEFEILSEGVADLSKTP